MIDQFVVFFLLIVVSSSHAQTLEHIGKSMRGVPVSQAMKFGNEVLISGTPALDASGKLSAGDFSAQMKPVMDNITAVLKASGAGWGRVAKINVLLTGARDFTEINRVYAGYFPDKNFSLALG